jgi:hypothetical protein
MEYDLLFSIALMFVFAVLAGRAVDRAIQKAKKRYRHNLSDWSKKQMWIVGGKARCR